MFEKFLRRAEKPNTSESAPERLLPSDIRYALQYREAKMGKDEVIDLVRNGFEQEAAYLLLKGAVDNQRLQQSLLQGVVDVYLGKSDYAHMRTFVEESTKLLAEGVEIEGDKLAQLSRQGFSFWHNLYAKVAEEMASSATNVFLVGHATFVGLDSFVKKYNEKHKKLYILIPNFFEQEDIDVCGYVIEEGVVSPLPKDFERIENATVLDDVKRSGESLEEVCAFWTNGNMYTTPKTKVLLDNSSEVRE